MDFDYLCIALMPTLLCESAQRCYRAPIVARADANRLAGSYGKAEVVNRYGSNYDPRGLNWQGLGVDSWNRTIFTGKQGWPQSWSPDYRNFPSKDPLTART